ncbi:serine/threonine-protein kinase [Pseudonocardia thermophila]|uniref:serine/threonine-protein kinase n=1 Tax=Pseudonocardia thermophila TaxID=1848 RepID=UPI00248EEDF7|nr:protein kinase [Pseudonocardia thermophila]
MGADPVVGPTGGSAADEPTRIIGMFGHYRLDEVIGRGGMGVVYRAYDTRRNRVVAIKRMPRHLATDEEFRTRFQRESALAAKLREPHVVPIHDYGEIDGQLYIDMRLVEGVDLGTVLRKGPLTLPRAVDIVSQIADALDAAHEDGLVHRDVKPSNILLVGKPEQVVERGFAYLTDFGVAANIGGSTLSRPGLALGTASYMAPERMVGEPWDHRVDVYSLACLLFEIVVGHKPYLADDLLGQLQAHLNRPIPRPSELADGVPPGLDDIIATGMAKKAADRYDSCGALAAAARELLETWTPPVAPAVAPVIAESTLTADALRPVAGSAPPTTTADASSLPPVETPSVAAPAVAAAPSSGADSAPEDTVTSSGEVPAADGTPSGPVGPDSSGPRVTLSKAPAEETVTASGETPVAVPEPPTEVQPPAPPEPTERPPAPEAPQQGFWETPATAATTPHPPVAPATTGPTDLGDDPLAGPTWKLAGPAPRPAGWPADPGSDPTVVTIPRRPTPAPVLPGQGFEPEAAVSGPTDRAPRRRKRTSPLLIVIGSVLSALAVAGVIMLALFVFQPPARPVLTTVATFTTGAAPAEIALSPDGSRAYITNKDAGTLSVLDTATGEPVAAPIPVGDLPNSVRVSADGSRVFVTTTGSGTVTIVDAATNTVAATVPIGGFVDGIALSPDGTRLYAGVADRGEIVTIDVATARRIGRPIKVGDQPYGMDISPDGRRLYVPNFGTDDVSVIDTQTGAVVATVPVGDAPLGAVVSPDGSRLYVTNQDGGTVSILDTATNAVIGTVAIGPSPVGIALSRDGGQLYVTGRDGDFVRVLTTGDRSLSEPVAAPAGPVAIAVAPDGRVLVVGERADAVSVMRPGRA